MKSQAKDVGGTFCFQTGNFQFMGNTFMFVIFKKNLHCPCFTVHFSKFFLLTFCSYNILKDHNSLLLTSHH